MSSHYKPNNYCNMPSPVFVDGKSPRLVYAKVWGIDIHSPLDGDTPNRHYELNQESDILWHDNHRSFFKAGLTISATQMVFRITVNGGYEVFIYNHPLPISTFMANDYTDPSRDGNGGYVQLVWYPFIGPSFGFMQSRHQTLMTKEPVRFRLKGGTHNGCSIKVSQRYSGTRVLIKQMQFTL